MWTSVQQKTAGSLVTGTAISCTFDAAPTPGNFLLAVVAHSGATILPDSSYGPFLHAVGNFNVVYHYVKVAGSSESATFSVTSGATVSWAVILKEYSDIPGSEVANDTVVSNATQNNSSSFTLDNTLVDIENDLCVASFAQQDTNWSATWSTGWTEIAEVAPASVPVIGLAVADQVLTDRVTVPMTITLAGSTTSRPSKINQAMWAFGDAGRFRPKQQQSWSQW
jgi:hypothetical protein